MREDLGPQDIHLGEKSNKVQLEDGITVWYMTCVAYLRGAINNVDSILKGNREALKSFGDGNFPYPSYSPSLNVTNELYEELTNIFSS